MASHHFVTLFTWDTLQSADTVEWCPLSPFQSVFVCGTYQIEQGKQDAHTDDSSLSINREGRIYVFNMTSMERLEPHQSLHLSAVLDMKWCPIRVMGKVLLAVVTASGDVNVYELLENLNLTLLATVQLSSQRRGEILALSLDWSTGKALDESTYSDEVHVVVSDSKGKLNLFHLNSQLSLSSLSTWHCHDYEAWITSFNYWDRNNIFSGGDDSKLKGWDIRKGVQSPTFVNGTHGAGVTSLHCNPHYEHILASGSYDEYLRLWDLRNMKDPLYVSNLHGGVWRLKWDPHYHQNLIAACMYGGFHTISCESVLAEKQGSPTVIASYENHESIAYGSDWSHLSANAILELLANREDILPGLDEKVSSRLFLVATCSFYDHRLCISVLK